MAIITQLFDLICFRCGECCRRYQVLLDRTGIALLSKHMGLSTEDFRRRYADPRWPGTNTCLVQQINGSCPFLRGEGREFLCTVHLNKPQPCRDWAASPAKLECQRGLQKLWKLTVDSSGHLQGMPEDISAFQGFLNTCAKEE
ncbi:MAG: YkgJ family cysteine cluster protein [Dehalococcoidia bacterium]|nr:YkgJ family cysteine cluster protein [Dehalococcoidia bacterium]